MDGLLKSFERLFVSLQISQDHPRAAQSESQTGIKLQSSVKGFQGLFVSTQIDQHIAFIIMDERILRIEGKRLIVDPQFIFIAP